MLCLHLAIAAQLAAYYAVLRFDLSATQISSLLALWLHLLGWLACHTMQDIMITCKVSDMPAVSSSMLSIGWPIEVQLCAVMLLFAAVFVLPITPPV